MLMIASTPPALAASKATPAGYALSVMVGGEAASDPCGVATVVGLRTAKSFLAVRAGPDRSFPERDRLTAKQRVYICETVPGWSAVIYPRKAGQDCELSSPRAARQAYRGPCRWGWVSTRFLAQEAG
jgi:hypothetical protein